MGLLERVSIDEIRARGSIKDNDVLQLRGAFYDDAAISRAEADALFDLDDACAVKDPAWADFFLEAITDYIVNQAEPEGYIVAANADWLMQRIASDRRMRGRMDIELLAKVLEAARWSPPSLVRFAMEQVKQAILDGAGPTRASEAAPRGVITTAEVELLRRLLFAFGGDGNIAVTRPEAEMLMEINKAIAPGKSSPEFTRLFVQAVANAVLHGLGYAVPSRQEALEAEAASHSLDEREAGALVLDAFTGGAAGSSARSRLGGFLGRMVPGGGSGAWGTYRAQSSEELALAKLERQRLEIITSETIGEADADWLASWLGADGALDENEMALLEFLHRECPILPPVLQRMIDDPDHAA